MNNNLSCYFLSYDYQSCFFKFDFSNILQYILNDIYLNCRIQSFCTRAWVTRLLLSTKEVRQELQCCTGRPLHTARVFTDRHQIYEHFLLSIS